MTPKDENPHPEEFEILDEDAPMAEDIPVENLLGDDAELHESQVQNLYDSGDKRPYGVDQAYTPDEDEEGRVMKNDRSFRRDDDALTADPADYFEEDPTEDLPLEDDE